MFYGSQKRIVSASNCAHSEPNALTDMQNTSTREFSSASSLTPALSPEDRESLTSNHTSRLSFLSRFANSRKTGLSLDTWLRKKSHLELLGMDHAISQNAFTTAHASLRIAKRLLAKPFEPSFEKNRPAGNHFTIRAGLKVLIKMSMRMSWRVFVLEIKPKFCAIQEMRANFFGRECPSESLLTRARLPDCRFCAASRI